MTSSKPRTHALVPFVLLPLVILLGVYPFLGFLGDWPATVDAAMWIGNGLPDNPEWYSWVFETSHFKVGFRPLTALTFTWNAQWGGVDPLAFRLFDFGLHAATAVLVYALCRTLFRDRPQWTGLLAAFLFLAHPVAEEVLPYFARRSYSLAAFATLAALVVSTRTFARDSIKGEAGGNSVGDRTVSGAPFYLASLFSAFMLALGFFGNEVAILGSAMIPVLAIAVSPRGWGSFRRVCAYCVLPALILGAALAIRYRVVAGIGGYEADEELDGRALSILSAFGKTLLALPKPKRDSGWPLLSVETAVLVLAIPYYLAAVVGALRTGAGGLRRLALLIWIGAYAALYTSLGIWFPRQAYIVVIPLAILCAELLGETLQRGGPLKKQILRLVPQLALLVYLATHSAIFLGQAGSFHFKRGRTSELFDTIAEQMGELQEPAVLRLVLPYRPGGVNEDSLKRSGERNKFPRSARHPVRWLEVMLKGKDVKLEETLYYSASGRFGLRPTFEETDDGAVLIVPDELSYVRGKTREKKINGPEADRIVPIPAGRPYRSKYVYLVIQDEEGWKLLQQREPR